MLEMLDAMEAGIAALRSKNGAGGLSRAGSKAAVARLTLSARRDLLHDPAAARPRPADRTKCHPFSRIEEL